MLTKRARNTRAELTLLLKTGTRSHGRLFTFVSKRSDVGTVSVIVSKKVARTAVGRHRIRRRAYAVVRENIPKQKLALIAKKEAGTATFAALRADIAQYLARAV